MKQIQSIFAEAENNAYFIIGEGIQNICLLYFHKTMDTKILTDDEIDLLMKLFVKFDKPQFQEYQWDLLYRASRDGLSNDIARAAYEKKKNIICFIHSENDCVFGGIRISKVENLHYLMQIARFMMTKHSYLM